MCVMVILSLNPARVLRLIPLTAFFANLIVIPEEVFNFLIQLMSEYMITGMKQV